MSALQRKLHSRTPVFFILAGAHTLDPARTRRIAHRIYRGLGRTVTLRKLRSFLIIDQSSSALHNRCPVRASIVTTRLNPFSTRFLIPTFFRNKHVAHSDHRCLVMSNMPAPIRRARFTGSSIFNCDADCLPSCITRGATNHVPTRTIRHFALTSVHDNSLSQLVALTSGIYYTISNRARTSLSRFTRSLLTTTTRNGHFLFHDTTDVLATLTTLPPRPVSTSRVHSCIHNKIPKTVVINSRIRGAARRLRYLLRRPKIINIRISITRLQSNKPSTQRTLLSRALGRITRTRGLNGIPIVCADHRRLAFSAIRTQLTFNARISDLLVSVLQNLPRSVNFLVDGKNVASGSALDANLTLGATQLLKRVLPKMSMIHAPTRRPRFPALPIMLFPNGIKGRRTLTATCHHLIRS